MNCEKCGAPMEDATTGYCGPCTLKIGESLRSKKLSKEDLRMLRLMVKEETAGLISMEVLKQHLEEMYERLAKGEPFDEVIDEKAIVIQQLAGMGMCREMLKFTQALGSLAGEQEEEIRAKMRRLMTLGEERR